MTMPRGVVHACHVGRLVHSLEGWMHHEVGIIDVNHIDITWNAALKHGFKPEVIIVLPTTQSQFTST